MMNRNLLLGGGVALVLAGTIGTFAVLRGDASESPQPAPVAAGALADQVVDAARVPIPVDSKDPIPMTVYLSPTCGCCAGWVEHMKSYGFDVKLEYQLDLTPVKEGFVVPGALQSCHTAVVNGYVIEGHVPGDVVRDFLAEAPPVRGLAAPGMPVGSPGMETADGHVDPYDVVTFTSAGQTALYSRQGGN
jgi:hypothetical protein